MYLMKIMEITLKSFKAKLKPWLKDITFDNLRIRTSRKTFAYKAEVADSILIVTVPGKKVIENEFIQISSLSLKRKKHTITTFINKRIRMAEMAL